MRRHTAQAQLDMFAAADTAIEQRQVEAGQAVRLYAPPVTESVTPAELPKKPEPPKPALDCWMHWPPVRSAWYLVQRRWTCAVCYPRLGD